MEKLRTVSVKELIKMFVAISYLQEQRIIKYSDIYTFINNNKQNSDALITDLIDESVDTINELVSSGVLSCVYPNYVGGIYRINDKIDFLEISKYPKDYLKDMNKVFLEIIQSNNIISLSLTLSNSKQKNNR